MKQAEVKVGSKYLMHHTSGMVAVEIREEIVRQNFRGNRRVHWLATNLKTGRTIEIKSAAKLRFEITGYTNGHWYL